MYELELNTSVSESLEQNTHQMMKRVFEIAPYLSTCRGLVEKNGDGYTVKVEIRSAEGLLTGLGTASQLSEALHEAESGVQTQIDQWKKIRFQDPLDDPMAQSCVQVS